MTIFPPPTVFPFRWPRFLVLALGLAAVDPAGAAPPPAAPPLDAGATAQIQALFAEKRQWTPVQQKLETALIRAVKQQRGEAFAPGAPHLRPALTNEADGRVLVDIHGAVTGPLVDLLTQNGGIVVASVPEGQSLRARVSLAQLETLAALPEVTWIRRAARPRRNTGSVESQGDATHLAAAARALYGVGGLGINIGVLSDSVDGLAASQATGDLGPVTVLAGQSGVPATGEGVAMLEVIHDLAPNAGLFFATAAASEASFAANIIALYNAGCSIIVDDVGWPAESPFQDGPIAQAVNTVTAAGALVFSAAGNAGNFDSGSSGTWEGDFVPGGSSGAWEPGAVHNFGGVTSNPALSAGSGQGADLFWSDQMAHSANDYDLFVLDAAGVKVVDSSNNTQNGSQDPYEFVTQLNTGERLAVVLYSGDGTDLGRFLHLDTGDGVLGVATGGAIYGHPGAANAIAVAAVNAATAYPNAFAGGAANPVEIFSGDGPRHIFYSPAGTPLTPGNVSAAGGQLITKPDLAAADGVSVFAAGFSPFFGTSAAAPHAAAIAALLKSYNPALTPGQIRAVLTTTAVDAMAPGVDRNSGWGIVMAEAALQAAPPDGLLALPGAGGTATGPLGGPFLLTTASLTLTNNGATTLNWSLANSSAWLDATPTNGTLAKAGTNAVVTLSVKAAATNLAAGVYPTTLWFTNSVSHLGQSRTFTLTVLPAPSGATFPAAVLALNPVGYWRLNETNLPPAAPGSTNVGSLGTNENLYCFQGVAQGQPGVVGNAFGFSNPGQVVPYLGTHADVPYAPQFNPNGLFSVELWVRPTGFVTDLFCPAAAVDDSQNSGNSRAGWIFYQTPTNTWEFLVGGLNGYVATAAGGTVNTQAWTHLVGVYDGAVCGLYVNGVLVSGAVSAPGFSPNSYAPVRLGATSFGNRTFNGLVDEVACYTNVLSAARVAAHHTAGTNTTGGYAAAVLTDHPIGYWHLDEAAVPAAAQSALPVAVNYGTLAPLGNGRYQPGGHPGVDGVPAGGLEATNTACQFTGGLAGNVDIYGSYLNFTGPLSLLAWIKSAPADGNVHSMVSKGAAAYRLEMDGTGHPHFANGTQPGGDLVGTTRVDDGQWHLLIGVHNGGGPQSLYLDGRLAAANTTATTKVNGNSGEVWLGGDPDAGAYRIFNGVVDEVAVFTNALTAAQVSQLYTAATNTPPPVPTITSTLANHPTGRLTLTWAARNGSNYQVEYKTNLTQSAWVVLASVTATNSAASTTDLLPATGRRFYRIALLP